MVAGKVQKDQNEKPRSLFRIGKTFEAETLLEPTFLKIKNPALSRTGFDMLTERASRQLYYLVTYITSFTAFTTFSAFGKLAAIKVGAYGSGTS